MCKFPVKIITFYLFTCNCTRLCNRLCINRRLRFRISCTGTAACFYSKYKSISSKRSIQVIGKCLFLFCLCWKFLCYRSFLSILGSYFAFCHIIKTRCTWTVREWIARCGKCSICDFFQFIALSCLIILIHRKHTCQQSTLSRKYHRIFCSFNFIPICCNRSSVNNNLIFSRIIGVI